MLYVRCLKCGLGAYSKCPHCRSVFPDHDWVVNGYNIGMSEEVVSHRLVVEDDKVSWRFYQNLGEGVLDALKQLRSGLANAPDEALAVFACAHWWEFNPCCGSSCGCGHESPEGGSSRKFLARAIEHLTRLEGAPQGRYDLDDDDVAACDVIKAAFDQCER